MDLITRLRRPAREGWIPEIDGLRFLAIGSVVLFHMAEEMRLRTGHVIAPEPRYDGLLRVLENGDVGVRLFFVISGLVLGLPFARQLLGGARPVSVRRFYLRRLTRIEPPYLISIAFACTLIGVYEHGFAPGFWHRVLAMVGYVYALIYGEMSSVNPPLWSLAVEVQFYLIAPLAMQVFRVRHPWLRRGVLLAAIAGIGWAQGEAQLSYSATLSLAFYLQYFLAGLLLADVFVIDRAGSERSGWWDAAGLGALWCMFWPMKTAWVHGLLPFAIMALVLAALRGRTLRALFATEWIAVTGGMCYSIYLVHMTVIAAVFKVSRRLLSGRLDWLGKYAIQVVVLGVPVMVVAVAFYVLVERPCMDARWPQKLALRARGLLGATRSDTEVPAAPE